jgi:hypothetical protein
LPKKLIRVKRGVQGADVTQFFGIARTGTHLGASRPQTPAGYLTKEILLIESIHGAAWEGDDRQGNGPATATWRAFSIVR